MKTLINFCTVAMLIASATGCSKARQFTRQDYSLLRDPFARGSNIAEADEPPAGAERSDVGYAKLSDSNAQSPTIGAQPVSHTQPANAEVAEPFLDQAAAGLAKINDATTTLSDAAERANDAVTGIKTAAATDAGSFYEWAQNERASWTDHAPATDEKASPLIAAAEFTHEEKATPLIRNPPSAGQPAIGSTEPEIDAVPAGWPALPADLAASPPTRNRPGAGQFDASRVSSTNPFAEIANIARDNAASPPVFDAPPGEFRQPATPSTIEDTTLDENFQFDEGWKPAHLERL